MNLSPPHNNGNGNGNGNGEGGFRRAVPPLAAAANEAAAEAAAAQRRALEAAGGGGDGGDGAGAGGDGDGDARRRRRRGVGWDGVDARFWEEDGDGDDDDLDDDDLDQDDDDEEEEEGEGVDVSLYPLVDPAEASAMDGSNQRRFVQTIRSRVKGLYVTGMCAVAAPPPPRHAPGSPGGPAITLTELGFGALRQQAPPHDLVFVGTPSGRESVKTIHQPPRSPLHSVYSRR